MEDSDPEDSEPEDVKAIKSEEEFRKVKHMPGMYYKVCIGVTMYSLPLIIKRFLCELTSLLICFRNSSYQCEMYLCSTSGSSDFKDEVLVKIISLKVLCTL